MSAHVDGNALAGPLSDIFTADMTMATARCGDCGDMSPLATAMVYLKPNAWIVRCHVCDALLLTVVRSADANWIDFDALDALSLPR